VVVISGDMADLVVTALLSPMKAPTSCKSAAAFVVMVKHFSYHVTDDVL
jgi:hypothetical protein